MNKFNNSYFLWPKGSIRKFIYSQTHLCSIKDVENHLSSMFLGAYPVVCSSGRSAISLALRHLNVSRNDKVGIFPYASHCVLDAVSRFAIPVETLIEDKSKLKIIYHQWGYSFYNDGAAPIIEDAVDSFYKKGSNLMECGGEYEIWSLPKLIGSTSGGVLWCRSEINAEQIRNARDLLDTSNVQCLMRLLGRKFTRAHLYWQSFEGYSCSLTTMQASEILMLLRGWEEIYSERLERLKLYKNYLPKWIKLGKDRVPCVLPIEINIPEQQIIELGIESGYRHFFRGFDTKTGCKLFARVVPVPIHSEVNDKWLNFFFNEIEKTKDNYDDGGN